MTITAYVYEAALHCPGHARERFGVALDDPDTADSEGNPISVLYSHDMSPDDYCDECLYECIAKGYPGHYANLP